MVEIAPTVDRVGNPFRYEGASFEDALRSAVRAGRLNAEAVEKQIAFLERTLSGPPSKEDTAAAQPSAPPAGLPLIALAESRLFPTLAAAISALVHEIQRERGASSLYASSGGRLGAVELRHQWPLTDQRRVQLKKMRASRPEGMAKDLMLRLKQVEEHLARVFQTRDAIGALKVTPVEIMGRYTEANVALLNIIDDLVGRSTAQTRGAALAWIALLHAKEKTGMERAQLVTVFVSDCFEGDQQTHVPALIAARDSYLHLFSVVAPRPAREVLQRALASPYERAVAHMERVALGRQSGGFGIDPSVWFAAISRSTS